jgi:hypothetical protein
VSNIGRPTNQLLIPAVTKLITLLKPGHIFSRSSLAARYYPETGREYHLGQRTALATTSPIQPAIQYGLHDRDRRYYLVIAMCKTQARGTADGLSHVRQCKTTIRVPRIPCWSRLSPPARLDPFKKASDSSASTYFVVCLIPLIFHPSSLQVCSYPHE